jgi:hypothetical protein
MAEAQGGQVGPHTTLKFGKSLISLGFWLKFWEKLNILWKFGRFPRRTLENLIILGILLTY